MLLRSTVVQVWHLQWGGQCTRDTSFKRRYPKDVHSGYDFELLNVFTQLHIPGMACAACSYEVLEAVDGVSRTTSHEIKTWCHPMQASVKNYAIATSQVCVLHENPTIAKLQTRNSDISHRDFWRSLCTTNWKPTSIDSQMLVQNSWRNAACGCACPANMVVQGNALQLGLWARRQ